MSIHIVVHNHIAQAARRRSTLPARVVDSKWSLEVAKKGGESYKRHSLHPSLGRAEAAQVNLLWELKRQGYKEAETQITEVKDGLLAHLK
jgi:hypothetical protein